MRQQKVHITFASVALSLAPDSNKHVCHTYDADGDRNMSYLITRHHQQFVTSHPGAWCFTIPDQPPIESKWPVRTLYRCWRHRQPANWPASTRALHEITSVSRCSPNIFPRRRLRPNQLATRGAGLLCTNLVHDDQTYIAACRIDNVQTTNRCFFLRNI